LKDVKSEVLADFIHSINKGVIIITNKAAVVSDLSIIKKYIKDVKNIDLENISSPYLPQSKSYLKILGIPYLMGNSNLFIISDIIEEVLKSFHPFNEVTLASHLHIIKASPKSNIAVI